MPFQSTKTYGHEVGLSCSFRQWGAKSHCSFIHGYAIAVKFVFEAKFLDENGWVVDFGNLKEVKSWLADNYDHKLLVASNDPHLDEICGLAGLGIADVRVVKRVGCEAFAGDIFTYVAEWCGKKFNGRVRLVSCEVKEHGANSAIYKE